MKSLKKMDWNGLMTIPQRESSYDTLGTWALAPLRHAKRRRHPGRLLLFLMVKPCQTYSSGHIFYQSWVILSLIFCSTTSLAENLQLQLCLVKQGIYYWQFYWHIKGWAAILVVRKRCRKSHDSSNRSTGQVASWVPDLPQENNMRFWSRKLTKIFSLTK